MNEEINSAAMFIVTVVAYPLLVIAAGAIILLGQKKFKKALFVIGLEFVGVVLLKITLEVSEFLSPFSQPPEIALLVISLLSVPIALIWLLLTFSFDAVKGN